MSLSRRQFVSMAERIKASPHHSAIKVILCNEFDRFFTTYSTTYDSRKFVTACGFTWPLTREQEIHGPDSTRTPRTE